MAEIPEVNVYPGEWNSLKTFSDFGKIIKVPWTRYEKEVHPKYQAVLHHTVSGDGITGDIKTWEKWRAVGTCVILDRDGGINQLFSSKYWAYHLKAGNSTLDKQSIGVELDNWGGLFKGNGSSKQFGKRRDGSPNIVNTKVGKYYATYGNSVNCPVTHYPDGFRGYYYFESYTEPQLRSLGELLLLWNQRYDIPLDYHEDMWQRSQNALSGTPGIWAHVSYRYPKAKQDAHPQPELIRMLKTLKSIV
jgi:hypothetical protein